MSLSAKFAVPMQFVNPNPLPNGIDTGGMAVGLNCPALTAYKHSGRYQIVKEDSGAWSVWDDAQNEWLKRSFEKRHKAVSFLERFLYPIKVTCQKCKSEDVVRDATAAWNVDRQEWELCAVMDQAFCNVCGGETTLEIAVSK